MISENIVIISHLSNIQSKYYILKLVFIIKVVMHKSLFI